MGAKRAGVRGGGTASEEREDDHCPLCGAAGAEARAVRIAAARGRPLQLVREGSRKLFGKERKEVFLAWFALTANAEFAAEQAGVCRQTVSRHRMNNPDFAEAYAQAIALSVPDLQARLIAYAKGRPKLDIHGELEPEDEGAFDPQLALQILREQQRMVGAAGAGGGRALKPGRAPQVATNAEVKAALTKLLKIFAARRAAMRTGGDKE